MTRSDTFLTAEWNNLLMLNYAVDRSLIERFVPSGTELDEFEGHVYVSLVGFEFNRSRILGFAFRFIRHSRRSTFGSMSGAGRGEAWCSFVRSCRSMRSRRLRDSRSARTIRV